MGSIKHRNVRSITEAEDIKRWQEYTQKQKQKLLTRGGKDTQKNCTKKIFTTQIITMA